LFRSKTISEGFASSGAPVGLVKADKDVVAKLTGAPEDAKPSLIVFDLNNANAKPLTLIPKLKAKLKRGTSVIGFLSHVQGDLKVKALEAGCDMVMPRSAFSQNLPNLLRRHGLDEELEAAEA
jgi:CheY-like chemotaxis protein